MISCPGFVRRSSQVAASDTHPTHPRRDGRKRILHRDTPTAGPDGAGKSAGSTPSGTGIARPPGTGTEFFPPLVTTFMRALLESKFAQLLTTAWGSNEGYAGSGNPVRGILNPEHTTKYIVIDCVGKDARSRQPYHSGAQPPDLQTAPRG